MRSLREDSKAESVGNVEIERILYPVRFDRNSNEKSIEDVENDGRRFRRRRG